MNKPQSTIIPDRRIHAWRDDLADNTLENIINVKSYVRPQKAQVVEPATPLFDTSNLSYPAISELRAGEIVKVFENKDRICWVQNQSDDYVGYCKSTALTSNIIHPTHKISVPRALHFSKPDLKSKPVNILSFASEFTAIEKTEKFFETNLGGWIHKNNCISINHFETDPLSVAEKFLYTPYLWGGRSGFGLDCSGLIQITLQACNLAHPRDTDMQEKTIGVPLLENDDISGQISLIQRNDLIFWKGHVGMCDGKGRVLHANATDMAATWWDIKTLIAHILKIEGEPVRAIKRLELNTRELK